MKRFRYTYICSLSSMISLMLCLLLPVAVSAAGKKDKKAKHKTVIPKRDKLKEITNATAAIQAFAKVIPHHSIKDMDVLAEEIMSQHKKNPEVATKIAEAFFYNSGVTDSAHTMKYANMAMTIDKTYAPAYKLAGELLERKYRDTLAAAKWYEAGVNANPKHPDCYLAYSKMMSTKDITKSEEMFNKLLTALPDYPAYLKMAKIYERLFDNNINKDENWLKTVEFYEKEKPENIGAYDWLTFAIMGSFKGYQYQLDVCKKGLSFFPRYYLLNRSAGNYAFNLKKYDEAQKYYENLIFNSDTAKIQPEDIRLYARCFKERKNYTKAIEWLKTHMAIDSITEEQRQKSLADLGECYIEMGDYDLAIKSFENNLAYCRANGQSTISGLQQLINVYASQSEECMGEEKLACYAKMDSIWEVFAQENPDYAENAYYRRWVLNLESNLNHPETCVACFEKIVVIDIAKGDENRLKSQMPTVYSYLSRAYYLGEGTKKNIYKADEYCNKCLELDPQNDQGNKLRAFIDKGLPKSKRRR